MWAKNILGTQCHDSRAVGRKWSRRTLTAWSSRLPSSTLQAAFCTRAALEVGRWRTPLCNKVRMTTLCPSWKTSTGRLSSKTSHVIPSMCLTINGRKATSSKTSIRNSYTKWSSEAELLPATTTSQAPAATKVWRTLVRVRPSALFGTVPELAGIHQARTTSLCTREAAFLSLERYPDKQMRTSR